MYKLFFKSNLLEDQKAWKKKKKTEGKGNNFSFLFLPIFKTNRANTYVQNEKGYLSTTLFPIHPVGFQNGLLLSVIYWASIQPRGNDKHFGEYKGYN